MDTYVKIFFLAPLSIFIFEAFVIDRAYGVSSRFDDFLETKNVKSDFALGQSLITRLTDLSFFGCLKECGERPRCLSVNYFQHFLLCELNHKDDTSSPTTLQPAKGTVFAVLQPWMKDKRCRQKNEDENYMKKKCHVDKSGHPIYTISDCGFPSTPLNAKLDHSNGIGLYSKVVYKCNEGYVQRGKLKISCQDNGNWSSTDFQCLKECEPGQEPDGDTCKNCPKGRYSPSRDTNKCTKCPSGQYQDQEGMVACMNCSSNDNPCTEPHNFQETNVFVEPNDGRTKCRAVYSCNNSSGNLSKLRKIYVLCDRDGVYRHWTKPSLNCDSDIPDLSAQFQESGCEQLNASVTSPTTVRINDTTGRMRYCTQYADDVWTVIQQRTSPAGDNAFNKTWEEYKNGFGSLNDDYWIGNEILSSMTTSQAYEIAVLLWKKKETYTQQRTARYEFFKVHGEDDRYKLVIKDFMPSVSDAGEIIDWQWKNFSTIDKDSTLLLCSMQQKSGWWHKTNDGNTRCTTRGNVNALMWASQKDKTQVLIRPKQ